MSWNQRTDILKTSPPLYHRQPLLAGMFALSATSLGSTSTGCFYNNTPGKLFPQPTFFDQVAEQPGMTWKNYYNDTPWELFMESIAYGTERAIPPAFD